MNDQLIMENLRQEIHPYLIAIQQKCLAYNLTLSKGTLVLRDPHDVKTFIIVTNDNLYEVAHLIADKVAYPGEARRC